MAVVNVVPKLATEAVDLSRDVAGYVDTAYETVIDWSTRTGESGTFVKRYFREDIAAAEREGKVTQHTEDTEPITTEEKEVIKESVQKNTLGRLSDFLQGAMQTTLDNLLDVVTGTLTGLVFAGSGLLLIFYFLLDGTRLRNDFLRILPKDAKGTANYFLNSFADVMTAFIKGQVMLGGLTGLYMFIIYTIFGVPYAIVLGFIMAVAEFMPVVGTYIGLIPGLIIALFTLGPLKTAIIWACSYAFQTVKDNILTPRIQGEAMGLHPLVVLLALLICAKLGGLVGILFALPLASIVKVVIHYFIQTDKSAYTAQSPPTLGDAS
jgi:predicted PurR-regulated permease PerM